MIIARKTAVILFVIMALVQIFALTISISENMLIIKNGKTYKFKSEPVDPFDPFRGKYITLRLAEEGRTHTFKGKTDTKTDYYAVLEEDSEGYAKIVNLVEKKPEKDNYVKVRLLYSSGDEKRIKFKFNKYYMNEFMSYKAEQLIREKLREQNSSIFAEVSVLDGKARIKSIIVNGLTIEEALKNYEAEKK